MMDDDMTNDADGDDGAAETELRKPDLIEMVAARTGGKKKEARQAVEATLAVLTETLLAGRGMNLPPLGRVRVTKTKDAGKGQVLVLRVRRAPDGKGAVEALETDGEDG